MIAAIGLLAMFFIALKFIRFDIESAEYPDLLAACQQASDTERAQMIAVVREAGSKSDIFNFTYSERDRFLKHGGYCASSSTAIACKPIPKGKEAEGIAVNIFGGGGCDYPPRTPNVCKPSEKNFRC